MNRERHPARTFCRHLATALATAGLYGVEHAQVKRLCELAAAAVTGTKDAGLSLLFIEDELVADGRSLGRGMYIDRLARQLRRFGISHLKLLPGLDGEELRQFIRQLSEAAADARIRASANLRLGRVEIRYSDGKSRPDAGGEIDESNFTVEDLPEVAGVEEIPEEELARFAEICETVRKKRHLHVVGISEIVARFVAAFTSEAGSFFALAPLRELDEYTFTHSINVCTLNIAQAMALGISGQMLHDIGVAALLHDMGKLFVPEEILTKKGQLDEREWELVRQHPVRGARYLLETPGVPRLAVIVAYEHHIQYDRQGYPQVPAGWKQNICSQLTTISDVFDALRTERAYRGSMQVHHISQILLQNAGSKLNPQLTHNFLRVLERVTSAAR
ncbi:HD-GYP domain-containing protein (c-di-GMP phosphodiesterase class II) [Geothermobacter ehrlichii]|uniref:HD-GYP domain-containing protein (C-di-GMP phosphodiesterase class II) n=1 Tax=Geothermobacter ehrlichii TaxID=213224 RepID=A0A5D3WJA2_9BACT|nr:HD domain-containing phosphohydrolase [Geothermobacter ehrlichii]TYO98094.1 HD-GYP domain-containing protein (c-di-GMP phosphodiesterase class II) [Geothermobacter ehrlichii]